MPTVDPFPPGIDNPVWENSTDEADAVHKLSSGMWLPGSNHDPGAYQNYSDRGPAFLNNEELNFLRWTEEVTSQMATKKASTRVAFGLWNQDFVSLYNSSKTMKLQRSEYFCRLSWGYHWCDPMNHGLEYHSEHWSAARGVELLEAYVRLSNAGRTNASIVYMGDSVVMETWHAGLCSLARAGVTFMSQCPPGVHPLGPPYSLQCFRHPRVRGTGVLAFFSDQGFQEETWRGAILGCPSLEDCRVDSPGNHVWDVILPNLGVHYNPDGGGVFKNDKMDYRESVAQLMQAMIEHAQHQWRNKTQFPTLHAFWGSSPQHFTGELDGMYRPGVPMDARCTAIHPSKAAFRSNRRRSNIVWEVMMEQLRNSSGTDCDGALIKDDPSNPQTAAALQTSCITKLLNTCRGGLQHLEMDPFLTHRPDAHPGARCAKVFPAELAADPTGEKCDVAKDTTSDCTHHCWGPLLFQPIWERLEIAVKFHIDRCGSLDGGQHAG
ncbi:hypothetical protein ACHAWF_003041 [Thalassiosira exigua]